MEQAVTTPNGSRHHEGIALDLLKSLGRRGLSKQLRPPPGLSPPPAPARGSGESDTRALHQYLRCGSGQIIQIAMADSKGSPAVRVWYIKGRYIQGNRCRRGFSAEKPRFATFACAHEQRKDSRRCRFQSPAPLAEIISSTVSWNCPGPEFVWPHCRYRSRHCPEALREEEGRSFRHRKNVCRRAGRANCIWMRFLSACPHCRIIPWPPRPWLTASMFCWKSPLP